MNVVYVRDLNKAIEFYRQLGIAVPDANAERPFAMYRDDAFTLLLTTEPVARRLDATWTRPTSGYAQLIEFFVDNDASVDDVWTRLTAAGYKGTTAPGNLIGPYATMVEDPDGNQVLITSEPS
jgi:predicted lactoylglutathione lyase